MDAQIVARGKRETKPFDFKKIVTIIAIVVAALLLIGIVSSIAEASTAISNHEHSKYCYRYYYMDEFYDDLEAGNLKSYKMDCEYADGAFGLGISSYFNGGIVLPLLVAIAGFSFAFVKRSRSQGYDVAVTQEEVRVTYSEEKIVHIPLCSIFTVEKTEDNCLNIVTSENAYTLRELDGCAEVYAAILELMPSISIKGPANNEQVLAKGYPPALKPLLLILLIILGVLAVIGTIASEEFAFLLVALVPIAIVLVFYLLAKTPYLVVTDKRVFYVSDFGRKLSLPMNKISVTVTHQWFKQLHIGATTGRIHLFWVRNTAELYDIINAVLNEKQ